MTALTEVEPVEKSYWRAASVAKRQEWRNHCYIFYPVVKIILGQAVEKLEYCERSSASDAMLVLAGTGSGKTAMCKQIAAYVDRRYARQDPERTICPCLQLMVPDPCTPLEFAVAILGALGDPRPRGRRWKEETISAAARMLRECEVRLVILDNTQDIPARRAVRGIEQIGARLREFIDQSRALWIFFGTDDALKVINGDPQLIRRISHRSRIPYFGIESDQSQKNFLLLLRKIDKWLPLAEPSCLCDPKLAGPIYIATEGIFDRIVKLVDRGWYEAVRCGRETMTSSDLAKAYTYVYGAEAEKHNPFGAEFVVRRLREPGEPFEILRGGT